MYSTNADNASHARSIDDNQKDAECSTTEQSFPHATSTASTYAPKLYRYTFFSSNETIAAARKLYIRVFCGGVFSIMLLIFTVFALLWGAFFRTPTRNLFGWIIDFDRGPVGKAVVSGLTTPSSSTGITWIVLSAHLFPDGVSQVLGDVLEHKTWIAVTVNPGSSDRLSAGLTLPNATYDGAEATSIYGVEARNENAFRTILQPSAEAALSKISAQFATQLISTLANSSALPQIAAVSPQILTTPISYKMINLHPFNQPLATLVIFTGLIFVVILSFFIAMIANGARESSNLHRLLTFRSLITLQLLSAFCAYFFVSLLYSLLSVAFQLNVSRRFGRSGFFVFWMMNYCGMLSVGLAIESMLTLLTPTFVPFFLLLWVMVNISVCLFPIEVLPILYHYGYAAPFYNISQIARTVIFGIKNKIGFHFSILIIWALISCATLTMLQYWRRRDQFASTKRTEDKGISVDVTREY